MALDLPDFPWDSLAGAAERARAHPEGLIDLSVGSPVDPTPDLVREALLGATDAHSYPQTAGSPALRRSIANWFERRRGVAGLGDSEVLPTIGSKELIATLPLLLGLRPGDIVVQPATAYPTYEIGAALVGATVVRADDPAEWPEGTKLAWINSPANPHGRVLGVEELRSAVTRARELGAVLASDECYSELSWEGEAPSVLDPRAAGGTREGLLAVYSLSKQSNLAGYRAAFVAGDERIVQELLAVRKHAGLIPPAPVQAAMIAALDDDRHVAEQRERYRLRRQVLIEALSDGGFRIDDSTGGLYLWVTRNEGSWATVDWFADRGVLVAPGTFYGDTDHVRVALTATDAAIEAAAGRIRA